MPIGHLAHVRLGMSKRSPAGHFVAEQTTVIEAAAALTAPISSVARNKKWKFEGGSSTPVNSAINETEVPDKAAGTETPWNGPNGPNGDLRGGTPEMG